MQLPHRKRIRHFDIPGHIHELTFSCYGRMPLLSRDDWKRELCIAIDRAIARHNYRLYAFVLMPEHVHLIVHSHIGASTISEFLKAVKRPFSFRIKKQLMDSGSELLEKLTVRQRPGVTTFRFWQEGPGYDRNLTEPSTIISAIEYVHNNPVRRRLVDRAVDWKYSSARWFLQLGDGCEPNLPRLHRLEFDMLQ